MLFYYLSKKNSEEEESLYAGIHRFSKVLTMLLCFYERPILTVLLPENNLKRISAFKLMVSASWLHTISVDQRFHRNDVLLDSGGNLYLIFLYIFKIYLKHKRLIKETF